MDKIRVSTGKTCVCTALTFYFSDIKLCPVSCRELALMKTSVMTGKKLPPGCKGVSIHIFTPFVDYSLSARNKREKRKHFNKIKTRTPTHHVRAAPRVTSQHCDGLSKIKAGTEELRFIFISEGTNVTGLLRVALNIIVQET